MTTIDRMRKAHSVASRKKAQAEEKALDSVLSKLKKKHGEEIFTSFDSARRDIKCVRTGFSNLDDLLTGEASEGKTIIGSGKGLPLGRIVELAGPPGVGKSSAVLHITKAFQDAGLRVAFIDVEHSISAEYARRIGVAMEKLLFSQPDSAEQALDTVDLLVKGKAVSLVVVDSVAALTPEEELEGSMDDQQIGLQARLMSKALRKITATASQNNVCVIFVNQYRAKIGGFSRFGPQETTTGGNALRYYASIRLDMRVIRQIRKGVKVVGIMSKLKVVKNKVAPPFREVFCEINFGKGIVEVHPSDDESVADKAVADKDERE